MKFYNNPAIISKTPILTGIMIEGANLSQLWRMWSEQSALGQSLWGWAMINVALILWCNFYRVCCPNERWAYWSTITGVFITVLVLLTVIYFRYVV